LSLLFGPAPVETKQNKNYRKDNEDVFFTAIPCQLLGVQFLKDLAVLKYYAKFEVKGTTGTSDIHQSLSYQFPC
jgi:hypothetical protein